VLPFLSDVENSGRRPMCVELRQLRTALRGYAAGFEAGRLSCPDAAVVVQHAAAIEHMAATIKALAAARAAEGKGWKGAGHRSAEEQLAAQTGTSVAGARETLGLGRRLGEQPDVADAALDGKLSPAQASAISDAVAAQPDAAATLLEAAAAGGALAELKNRCAEVKATAVDLEARRAAIHRRRYLRAWTNADGESHLAAMGNPEDVAQILAALTPGTEDAFRRARREGRQEHPDAYRFDALLQLALDATCDLQPDSEPGGAPDDGTERAQGRDPEPPSSGSGPGSNGTPTPPASDHPERPKARRRRRGAPVKLLIRVDLETLLRGFPSDGETCELVGYGPISVATVHKLAEDGDAFVAAILTKGQQLAGVAHLGRQPTARQRSFLQWLYPTCAAQGCPAAADHLQIDHRIDWADTHVTLIEWLDSLCHHDHDKKTRYGWSLVNGIGKRPFVPPTDPRHPRYQPPPDNDPP
jgi:hypothetical protein